jgi:hypothetical protein
MPTTREPGRLDFRLVYEDEHLVEIRARLAAGDWAGTSTAYTTLEDLRNTAAQLEAFAKRLQGEVRLVAGSDNGTGMVAVRFYPLDRARHLGCAVTFATATATNSREQSARLYVELQTEAAAFDRFVSQLHDLSAHRRPDAALDVVAA